MENFNVQSIYILCPPLEETYSCSVCLYYPAQAFSLHRRLCRVLHKLLLTDRNPQPCSGKSRVPDVLFLLYPVLRGLHIYVRCVFNVFICKVVSHFP